MSTMGLVLCVYEGREFGDDLDGFQVGSYSDSGRGATSSPLSWKGDDGAAGFPPS